MYFPKHWAKGTYTGPDPEGRELTITAFGWSSVSNEDAERHGVQRARRTVEKGIRDKRGASYGYGTTPFREEVTDSISLDGNAVAVISRNRYGALVLNAANVMFVDIDFPDTKTTGLWDSILLSISKKRQDRRLESAERTAVNSVLAWSHENPGTSYRLYRTHSGLRLLVTSSTYDPRSDESKRILTALKADPLYCALTERQECYRARLSPKPWRCQSAVPPSRFPRSNPGQEEDFQSWKRDYEKSCEAFSTCRLLKEHGSPASDPAIQKVVAYHDSASICQPKPLA